MSGPVMFTQYSSLVFDIISRDNKQRHGYADDHQIYQAVAPNLLDTARVSMESCLDEIRKWMLNMKLKINDAKTEYILFAHINNWLNAQIRI